MSAAGSCARCARASKAPPASTALLTERFRAALGGPPSGASWYAGRPVLITANDYTTRVFNGDVGVALPGPGGRFLVHFLHLGGGTRLLTPSRLPEHETVFAMTIHKAQGSEFERVEVVRPPATAAS